MLIAPDMPGGDADEQRLGEHLRMLDLAAFSDAADVIAS
jgi:hypothetical protein